MYHVLSLVIMGTGVRYIALSYFTAEKNETQNG